MTSRTNGQSIESLRALLNEAKTTVLQQEKDIGRLRDYVKYLEAENETHTRHIGTSTGLDGTENPTKFENIDNDGQIERNSDTNNEYSSHFIYNISRFITEQNTFFCMSRRLVALNKEAVCDNNTR